MSTFLTGATAWAGSDAALADNEVEQSKSVCASGTAFDIPVYISPIAVVFNLQAYVRTSFSYVLLRLKIYALTPLQHLLYAILDFIEKRAQKW